MDDQYKSKEELIQELNEYRGRVAKLEMASPHAFAEQAVSACHGPSKKSLCQTYSIPKQNKIEAKLLESKARYRTMAATFRLMADNMTDLLWAKDMDGRYLFANKAICEKLLNARDANEPIGKNDMFFAMRERETHPENSEWHTFGEMCADSDQIVINNRQPMQFDEFGNVGGEILYLDVQKAPIWDENGNMVGTVGNGHIVTREKKLQKERQQAEGVLQKTRDLFEAVIEQLQDGIGVAEITGNYTLVNSSFCNMTGYSKEELLKMNVRDLIPEEVDTELFPKVVVNQRGRRITQLQHKEGSTFYIEISATPIFLAGEQLVLGIVRDVTERQQAGKELNRLLDIERRQNAELKMLHEVSLRITSSLKLELILETIVDYAQEIMLASNAHIFLYDGYKVTFGAASWQNKRQKQSYSKVRLNGLTYSVARSGKQIVVPDVQVHPIFHDFRWGGAIVGLPLLIGDKVRGVMNVAFDAPRCFKEEDLRSLNLLGEQAAIAIENATLFATERDTRVQTEALIEATAVLNRCLDQERVLKLMLKQLVRVVDYDNASIMLMPSHQYDNGLLYKVVMHSEYGGGYDSPLPPIQFANLQHVQEVVQEKHPVIISDTQQDVRWQHSSYDGHIYDEHIYSWLGVPLIVQNKVIGILNLDKSEVDYYTPHHADIAFAFANQASVAIDNARLYQQAQRHAETKETLLREVNHRVGNNLAAIAGMLSLERRHLQVADQTAYQAIMNDLTNRVMGLSTVHNMLSASNWMPLQLDDLAQQIIDTALKSLPSSQLAKVKINSPKILVTADLAHHLALILNELATNSIKYSLLLQNEACITVNITQIDDMVRLEFRDTGPGYPPDVLNLKAYNVGIELIQKITHRSLQGDMLLYNEGGAVAVIQFKDETS